MAEASFPPVQGGRRASIPEVVQHLVASVATLRLEPGRRLPPERLLGEQLGVGRSLLREALKCLDLLGFIEIRQGDGTFIASSPSSVLPDAISWGLFLDPAHIEQLIEAREVIERALSRLAAQRRSDEDADRLDALLGAMRAAAAPADFVRADAEFHLLIARAAQNSSLSAVLESLKSLLETWILTVVEHAEGNDMFIEQHERIARAIRAKDAAGAEAAMADHIGAVAAGLRGALAHGG